MSTKSHPLLLVNSILAGAQLFVGGATLGDVIGKEVAGLLVLAVGAIQTAMNVYTNGQVTPNSEVVAQVDKGQVVAGPAAPQADGTPVDVTYAGEHRA